ncbi:site-specific integrase [Algoriphagus sp. D3-2-R+10]|uniref:site-specific integrase n=1 Tax=Algoriphagus aurantiacus TaxID=3103948 RepID=UPI002B380D45|nr:site-specific integrase [Algoriphagus sp. D3-2-R+10]MEB2776332.1 site-specific integrase [Algoriphagus sp. D3-2-R+10]
MLEKSFGLLFFLKPSKKDSTKSRYIYLRITVNGLSKEISTKRLWPISRWSSAVGRAEGTKEDARELNAYLDTIHHKAIQAKKQLLESDKEITSESLKNIILGIGDKKKMILEIFQEHNDNLESLVGKDFAPGTLLRYKTSLDHTRSFINWKYKKKDMDIKQLDYEFISSYAFWLKSVRNCNHNTTVKYLNNFKKVVLICINNGWLDRNPFIRFKMATKVNNRVFLSWLEIEKLMEKKFSIQRLSQVRDIFLFSCFTGLAYIDVKNLKRNQISTGIDGEKWIYTHRQKTDSPTRLPLLPKALQLIEKYKNHPQCQDGTHVLPVLSNQKMNSYLKEIADVCEINKPLTFHIARHTFATTITLANGVPIETVSKMLGHKSLKQTQHYAKILDTKISFDMKALREKLQ